MNYKKNNSNNNLGFSLIELTISIVIIALILAGITGYSSLVRQSELRSVISDLQNYKTIYQGFKSQYRQVPGDMINATNYWSTGCAVSITCNGNGNGVVNAIWNSSSDETARAWKHLNLSGYLKYEIATIPSMYRGMLTIGTYAPPSKIDNTGYYIAGGSDIGGSYAASIVPSPWTDNITNSIFIGRVSLGEPYPSGLSLGSLTGKEAWSIDAKMDDGTPTGGGNDTGKIRSFQDEYGGTSCINTGAYNLENDSISCVMGFQLDDRN